MLVDFIFVLLKFLYCLLICFHLRSTPTISPVARFATKKEITKIYHPVTFQVAEWRKGRNLPTEQGLVIGSTGKKGGVTALVDTGDVHCLMIGAAGVGKTAFFLYLNLEYACTSGMSFITTDTKGVRPDRVR